jgi:hypothetical protein
VNAPWAIRLARQDAAALAGLRLIPALEVGEDGATIWLRSKSADENLSAKLAGLPALARYEWLPSNQLRAIDQRIPSTQLPSLRWQPIIEWLKVEAPTAALPGILDLQNGRSAASESRLEPAKAGTPCAESPAIRPFGAETNNLEPLTLVRSSIEQEPELLLTTIDEFKGFAKTAAQVRLDRLQFAANADGSVLVRGLPLPPLPGARFALHGVVAVPAGYSWQPAVSAEVLASRFGISGDTLILWYEDGTFTRLHSEQFVPASRSALGATAAAFVTP